MIPRNGIENLAALGAKEVIKSAAVEKRERERERERRRIFLLKRTVEIEIEGKVVPKKFLEIERRRTLVEMREWRKRNTKKNRKVVITQVQKHLFGAGEGKRRRSKRNIR